MPRNAVYTAGCDIMTVAVNKLTHRLSNLAAAFCLITSAAVSETKWLHPCEALYIIQWLDNKQIIPLKKVHSCMNNAKQI